MNGRFVFLFRETIELGYFSSKLSEHYISVIELQGYKAEFTQEGKSFLQISPDNCVSGVLAKLPKESIWLLDQWKDIPFLKRSSVNYVVAGENVELEIYENNCCSAADSGQQFDYETLLSAFESSLKENTYGKCDIHLMFPCSFDSYRGALPAVADVISGELIKNIEYANTYEFSGTFFKQLRRSGQGVYRFHMAYDEKCLGSENDGESCVQPGFIYFTVHESTNIGIVGVVLPNARHSASYILQAFCGERFDIEDGGKRLHIGDWLRGNGISICGSPKAVVFAHNPLGKAEIINCLALEAKPIGRIISKELSFYAEDNIAQYDIASVHASSDCLLEIENEFLVDISDRFTVQAIEIFFVELLLLQVASIGRGCDRVLEYLETQGANYSERSNEILGELSAEMFNVVNFLDFNRFHFPTVRFACQEISNRFGIPREIEKYNKYREILSQMIELSSEERTEIEDRNMNLLLLLLALLSVLPIFESLYQLFANRQFTYTSSISWLGSLLSCFMLYAVFKLYKRHIIKKSLLRKRMKKWKK